MSGCVVVLSNYKWGNTIIITSEPEEGRIGRMNDNMDIKIIKKYEIIKKVGKGAYGQVWKCTNKKTRQLCALKRIFDAFRNVTDCQRTFREIMYLRELAHPNIIKLFNYEKSYNERDMYIEMEYVESDLATALKNQYLKDLQKEYIFVQVLAAVHYLHSGNLIHRDIKPSNILVGINCEAKLCDFGLIRTIGHQIEDGKLTDNIATRWYKAPQLLLSSSNYGKEIDVWSLGCLLGELYLGKPIFQGTSTFNQLQKIIKITGIPNFDKITEIIRSETSIAVLKSFINDYPTENQKKEKKESIGTFNLSSTKSKSTSSLPEYENSNSVPENYGELQQLIPSLKDTDSPFKLNTGSTSNNRYVIDLLTKLLQFDPRKRIKVEHIIQHPYCSRFRHKIEWKKMEKTIRVKYDNMKLTVDDYKILLGNEIKINPELSIGIGRPQNKRSSPEKDKLSRSIQRQQNHRASIYVPNQASKVSPINYAATPMNTVSNGVNKNNKSISQANRICTEPSNTSTNKISQADFYAKANCNPNMEEATINYTLVSRAMRKQYEVKSSYPQPHPTTSNNNHNHGNISYTRQMNNNYVSPPISNNTNPVNRTYVRNAGVGDKHVKRVQMGVGPSSRYSQMPTTYITTSYPRISTNQDKDNDKDRSEKSISINKSQNKSISNKSFRSNISNVSTYKQKSQTTNPINNARHNEQAIGNYNSNNNNAYIHSKNDMINSQTENSKSSNTFNEGGKGRDKSKSIKAGNNMSITTTYNISNANNGKTKNNNGEEPTDRFNYRESIDKKLLSIDQIRGNYLQHKPYPATMIPELVHDNSINSASSINSIKTPSDNKDQTRAHPHIPNLFIQVPDPNIPNSHLYHPISYQGFGRHSTVSSPYNSPTANIPRTSFPVPIFPSTPPPVLNSLGPQLHPQTYISQHKHIYPTQYIQTSMSLPATNVGLGSTNSVFSPPMGSNSNMGMFRGMK